MTNKEKLIKLYNESLKNGVLPCSGLCNCLYELNISDKNLHLFSPSWNDDFKNMLFWGADIENDYINYSHRNKFTLLRQTILAFLIAIED